MNLKKFVQSEYMAVQIREIEKYRTKLQNKHNEIITFQTAVEFWVSEGLAERFEKDYKNGEYKEEPTKA